MKRHLFLCLLVLGSILSCTQRGRKTHETMEQNKNELYLLAGTYSTENNTGIYVYRFDQEKGTATYTSQEKAIKPSYLVVSSDERFVYSVGLDEEKKAIANAFSFNKETGKLNLLNTQPTNAAGPCYINTDRNANFVVTANYASGTVSIFPLRNDGYLDPVVRLLTFEGNGPDKNRQEHPHLHCVVFSPDEKFLYAEDLGSDQVHKFNVSQNSPFLSPGDPDSFQVEPGSGPRHLTFHPNGNYAYLINELSGKVTAFRYDNGDLNAIQYIASDTTAGVGSKGSADIHISPDGRFLYASNRLKSDGIAIFSIHPSDGTLTFAGYQPTGIHPRNFIITPNGKYLLVANKDSNNIQIFRIDPQTGLLTDTGNEINNIDQPVCLKFIQSS
ncbi:MAG: lactonase family protein [Bacteroidales bacterium]|jgi:6-phosphogluconolactonase (cycloisomerase 2 family)|nr:lactonase family protein [Bacteroidales bacterium]